MPQGMTSMSNDMGMSKGMGMNGRGGHLYMQTNEIKNAVIHYQRSGNGTLTEVERVATGGAGSGTFKPISGQESAPNAFEGAGSVILSPVRKFPALLWPMTVDSGLWTASRPGTLSKERVVPPNR